MATDVSSDLERLKSDVEQLRRDLAQMTRTVRDLGAEKGHELHERARRQAAHAEQRISQEIVERPFFSLLTAFGVGYIVAKLLDSD